MKVSLTLVTGPDAGRCIEFTEPSTFIIGRAEDADLRLPDTDRFASRRHVHLEICPPGCRLKDVGTAGTGSPNKPLLNGEAVDQAELEDGDIVQLGYTQLRVSISKERPSLVTRECPGCGRSLQLFPDEVVPRRCDACTAEARRHESAEQQHRAACSRCGTDLSAKANSDGRAKELADVSYYVCEACLPSADRQGGQVVRGYHLIRQLGAGGMGTVYMAHHPPTARLWALKRIRDLNAGLQANQRFAREVLLQGQQVHRNIVRCIDAGVDSEGMPCVVTEFVDGGDLEEALRRTPRLPPSAVITLVCEILQGLEHVHSHSIVHRDLKPSNILLRGSSLEGWLNGAMQAPPIPKIADFGLAVCYGTAGGTRLTKLNTAMGTLMYMPPEQVRDARNVKETADLYAIGVMLYYLLTGRYSFNFPTPADIQSVERQRPELLNDPGDALRFIMKRDRVLHPFQIILREEPTPIRERNPDIGEQLAAVVDKAVRKRPESRFGSAAAFRSALLEVL